MKSPSPKSVALWRLEIIGAAFDESLTASERAKLLKRISRTPVRWPTGQDQRISIATLYRWIKSYREGGFEALKPKPRKDRGQRRARLPDTVVTVALGYLEQDPEQTWTFLLAILRVDFPSARIARSTLHRRVSAEARYEQIRRAHRRKRRRGRFVAKKVHKIWQCDAKGPFEVSLSSGRVVSVHLLTILDDASRAVLAAIIVDSPNLEAAVRVFRLAAERWGLPELYIADGASIFDSHAFRDGLAVMGVRRPKTKPRNPERQGKIEAYHRIVVIWFVKRLHTQTVVDVAHLQMLFDGMIAVLYQPHRHRGLRDSPANVLNDQRSSREVPRSRLLEAFEQEKRKRAHPKTGEVELQEATWIVPEHLRGKRLVFLIDPAGDFEPRVVEPRSKQRLELRRAAVRPEDAEDRPPRERWGSGPLQKLYDSWRGAPRPQAEAGFGLPEIYALLTGVAGRHVPGNEHEAALVQRVYRDLGPLARKPCEDAFGAIERELGDGRPIKTYLDALRRRVSPAPDDNEVNR